MSIILRICLNAHNANTSFIFGTEGVQIKQNHWLWCENYNFDYIAHHFDIGVKGQCQLYLESVLTLKSRTHLSFMTINVSN